MQDSILTKARILPKVKKEGKIKGTYNQKSKTLHNGLWIHQN